MNADRHWRPVFRAACTMFVGFTIASWSFADSFAGEAGDGFCFSESPGRLRLSEGDRPVFVYNHGVQHKAGVPTDRARACYVHPVYGLDGEVLTDDFPEDHYHHRGLFWAWPHVRIGGQEYDLWMLRGIRQQFEGWEERTVTPAGAVLAVENGWYVGEQRRLREQIRFHVHWATESERAIDIELQLTAVGEPVTLWGAADKSYGGLSLRFAPRQDTNIVTAAGPQSDDLNLARLAWADLTGRFGGRSNASGAAILVRGDHPDFPPTWITRHYGFLGVGWPGSEPFTLEPTDTIACRYRLLIHRAALSATELQQSYAAWRDRPWPASFSHAH